MESSGRRKSKGVEGQDLGASVREISYCAISELTPHPSNARKHSSAQIRAIAKSIATFGFNAPILANRNLQILAGHGRCEGAKSLGMTHVPVVFLDHLSEPEAQAYMLADNKLTDRSTWDEPKLAIQLKALSDLALEFDIEATGFEAPEIDFRIQSLEDATIDRLDEFEDGSSWDTSAIKEHIVTGLQLLPCLAQAEQTNFGSRSDSRTSSDQLSPVIAT
jgi:hypothetical protein